MSDHPADMSTEQLVAEHSRITNELLKPIGKPKTGEDIAKMRGIIALTRRRDAIKKELDWHNEMLAKINAEEGH
jgi:hypothetical protein